MLYLKSLEIYGQQILWHTFACIMQSEPSVTEDDAFSCEMSSNDNIEPASQTIWLNVTL